MKVMTVLGTRPEIIRLSRVISKLDQLCQHIVVHTGQNFDPNLSDIFFSEMRVRQPDYFLQVKGGSVGEQVGNLFLAVDKVLLAERPDALLILGDTNSGLTSFLAKRMGIPVFHMEAGNRSFDDRIPEEVNRRVIDHSSSVLMPYTQRSKENLLREGIESKRIYVTGNPLNEIINYYSADIQASNVHDRLEIVPGHYFLATMHRAENVDVESRLNNLARALEQVQEKYALPIICSLHPRTRNKMQQYGIGVNNDRIHFLEPLGFFDFIALEKNARCVLSDSGTVQEECCIFRVPNVTLRDVTERPETLECGSNMLAGCEPETILRCVETVLSAPPSWQPPVEYLEKDVSNKVSRIVLGLR